MMMLNRRAAYVLALLATAACAATATLEMTPRQARAATVPAPGTCALPQLTSAGLTLANCTLPGLAGGYTPPGLTTGGSTTGQGGPSATTLPGKLTAGSYSNSAGTLSYELYIPSTDKPGTAVPLVVALHGCTETADVYRQLSGWDQLAEAKGFIVLFPQQSSSRNSQGCWNWFQQADMQRGAGEPSIIAGMVSSVERSNSVDAHRVFAAGFSAGAAMANVMGATYPDVFAAVGVGSGCEYNGLPCVGYQGPDPSQTGKQAYQAMGSHARVMPAIVFQGDADTTVTPANAPEIVREWQVTDDFADDGLLNGSVPTTPTQTVTNTSPGGQSYTVTRYGDGHGNGLIEYWLVHGMNHAWSGGSGSEPYADPSGPNETAAMYAFFLNHPA